MASPWGERTRYNTQRTLSRLAAALGVFSALSGCGTLSSGTIAGARTPINEAVATTARQQTLMNVVRAHFDQSPVILDIVETDEAVSVQGQATGGVGGIGATAGNTGGTLAGRVGSAGATVNAGDMVTNRFIPLQGQALISQLSSQITVETLNALYDSDWPLQSIAEFAIDKLTPDNDDYDYAEDLLTQLDRHEAISLASAKSGFSAAASTKQVEKSRLGDITINTQLPSGGGGDALNVYFDLAGNKKGRTRSGWHDERKRLDLESWRRLQGLYRRTQPDEKGVRETDERTVSGLIELRNSPRTHVSDLSRADFRQTYLGPVMRTRTAIGILRYIDTQPDVEFVDQAQYEAITHLPWNRLAFRQRCRPSEIYILSPQEAIDRITAGSNTDPHLHNTQSDLDQLKSVRDFLRGISDPEHPTYRDQFDEDDQACVFSYGSVLPGRAEERAEFGTFLGYLKRFLLVVVSDSEVPQAYASWFHDGHHYAIMGDDRVSQRNLMLISQFLTIQATATPSPALTTISASGR